MTKVMLNYSGGKDSTAMLLLAIELDIDFVACYQDTGFEHSSHYLYLNYIEKKTGIKIEMLKNSQYKGLLDLITQKQMLPNTMARFCTSNLKLKPSKEFLLKNKDITESWIGVRTAESSARARRYKGLTFDSLYPISELPEFSKRDFSHVNIRTPIVEWSDVDVWDIHSRHNIKKNPLYEIGASRVGCYPCVLSSERSWYNVWQTQEGKANIKKLAVVEAKINQDKPSTTGLPHSFFYGDKTVAKLIEQFELRDTQVDMFSEALPKNEVSCSWCHT
tara:strand:- start:27 stop:854 length:828 start_codon:yes stop_codon:yes gene_type:complete